MQVKRVFIHACSQGSHRSCISLNTLSYIMIHHMFSYKLLLKLCILPCATKECKLLLYLIDIYLSCSYYMLIICCHDGNIRFISSIGPQSLVHIAKEYGSLGFHINVRHVASHLVTLMWHWTQKCHIGDGGGGVSLPIYHL